jgi:hypothetical protein
MPFQPGTAHLPVASRVPHTQDGLELVPLLKGRGARGQWLTSVILATWEVEIGQIQFETSLGK